VASAAQEKRRSPAVPIAERVGKRENNVPRRGAHEKNRKKKTSEIQSRGNINKTQTSPESPRMWKKH
jgi:hypothetical protein